MKLDADLCRLIMLRIEELDKGDNKDLEITLLGHSSEAVNYHLGQMLDGNLVKCHEIPDTEDGDYTHYVPYGITWDGHLFIDNVRDESIWAKVKREASTTSGTLSFEIIKALAVKYAKEAAEAAARLLG